MVCVGRGPKHGGAARAAALHYTVGTSGQRVTAGLPGTGMYWTQKINSRFAGKLSAGASQLTGNVKPAGTGNIRAVNRTGQLPLRRQHTRRRLYSRWLKRGNAP
jgi:hypothetical protein